MSSSPTHLDPELLVAEPKYFTAEQLASLEPAKIPKHVAIIPDGNRRWARRHAARVNEGHREGGNTLISIVRAAKELGIKAITFYLFSTENWSRDPEEVQGLMWLLELFLKEQRQAMLEGGMRLQTIGDISALPPSALRAVEEAKQATAHCDKIEFIAALNYGARDEIKRAMQKMVHDYDQGKIHKEQITETLISRYLDTAAWGDPDMLIRTSGESRISNFLLWQISYAEIFIADVLWPDFDPNSLLEAVRYYQTRDRRLGGGG